MKNEVGRFNEMNLGDPMYIVKVMPTTQRTFIRECMDNDWISSFRCMDDNVYRIGICSIEAYYSILKHPNVLNLSHCSNSDHDS